MTNNKSAIFSSFRDPASRILKKEDSFYRQITSAGITDFRQLTNSGLARTLVDRGMLTPFEVAEDNGDSTLLRLQTIKFVNYPYEWCFGQLRDAAVLTLEIMMTSLQHGMILKDASGFNVMFENSRPVFIDHGSFTVYRPDTPWQAYRQFVMHFLSPLLLMKHRDIAYNTELKNHLDGFPLQYASKLLPRRTWLELCPLLHIHLHSSFEQKYSDSRAPGRQVKLAKNKLLDLLSYLKDYLRAMHPPQTKTEWGNYYCDHNYSIEAFADKKRIVREFIYAVKPASVIDIGANNGEFSQIAASVSGQVIAADIDPAAVEQLYRQKHERILPLLQDLNNPSPPLGVLNLERLSFLERAQSDLVMGLALIHHLRISGNWPIAYIARFFAGCAPAAVIEFVPKDDSQVRRLLRSREDIYDDWTLEEVVKEFQNYYQTCETVPIEDCGRSLLLLTGRKR